MRWGTGMSKQVETVAAVEEAASSLEQALDGVPDLVLVFASHHHAAHFDELPRRVVDRLRPGCMIGCSASGTIGGGIEVERRESLSLVGARLPGVEVHAFALDPERFDAAAEVLDALGDDPDSPPHLLLLADPLTAPVEALLPVLDEAFPTSVKLGGLASGGEEGEDLALFLGAETRSEGLVGVSLQGALEIDPVVAQGCRPVGEPMIITRCRNSVIQQLNVGRPVDALQHLYQQLEPRDQELFRHSLFVGIEMKDATRFGQGDFLIRDVAGIDPAGGAIAVGGSCRDYQVIQFHLRDARTSAHDLERRLTALRAGPHGGDACGALLFSCVGRGESLYGRPNHDSDLFCRHMGALSLGGFFCNGEIGPVGGRTFLHGYTSAFGIFRPR